MKCLQCQKDFDAKRETAKYCSDKCKVKWHRKNGNPNNTVKSWQVGVLLKQFQDELDNLRELLKGKEINYQPTTEKSFDGKKITKTDFNEPSKFQQPKTFKKWVQERVEIEDPDDYEKWLYKLENDPFLSPKQKSYAKIADPNTL